MRKTQRARFTKKRRTRKGGMLRTLRRQFQSRTNSHVYNSIKDYFSPTGHSTISIDELVNLSANAPRHVSSTGKTYFHWLTLDAVFTKRLTDERASTSIAAILNNLYTHIRDIHDENILHQAHLIYTYYGLGNSVSQDIILELCNRLSIENDVCYMSFTNLQTNTQERIQILTRFYPTSKYSELLHNLFVSLSGTHNSRRVIIREIINRIEELDERYKTILLNEFAHQPEVLSARPEVLSARPEVLSARHFVENEEEQEMAPPRVTPAPATQSVTSIPEECALCLEPMLNNVEHPIVVNSRCRYKHVFHQDCLSNWCRRKKTCPICRTSLPNNCVFTPL